MRGEQNRRALGPDFARELPKPFAKLMQRCWDAEPQNRPSFKEILGELRSLKKKAKR